MKLFKNQSENKYAIEINSSNPIGNQPQYYIAINRYYDVICKAKTREDILECILRKLGDLGEDPDDFYIIDGYFVTGYMNDNP